MRRLLPLLACLTFACDDGEGGDPALDGGVGGDDSAAPAAIEVHVDAQGVAHVYGQTDEDVFFGYGYQVAKDRLYQLEMFRRRAYGRLSEVTGDNQVEDSQAKIFDWARWGALDAAKMRAEQPERWALLQAWVAGINKRVAEVRDGAVPRPYGFAELDFEPAAWGPDDPVIVQKMAGFGLDQTLEFEVFLTFAHRLFAAAVEAIDVFKPAREAWTLPQAQQMGGVSTPRMAPQRSLDFGALADWDPEPLRALRNLRGLGSNSWAIDGRHTAAGTPLIAGDPHMGADFSGLMYPIHLNSMDAGGTFDVVGYAFVGAPGIAAGHNRKLAWTPTSAFADVMDMWGVEIDDAGAHVGGEVVPVETRTETIILRGDGDPVGQGREVTLEVTDVPGYGVIMPPAAVGSPIPIAPPGQHVLVGWRGFQARTANYFLELNRAESLDDFDDRVRRLPEMSYNFVAADQTGITYQVGVEVPTRGPIAEGREPWRLMDGADPAALWRDGALGHDVLPHTRAPERGWIVTANNDPYGHTAGDVREAPFYYGAFFAPGWRAGRIEAEVRRLVERGDVALEDMQALQQDAHSNLADDLLPLVAELEIEDAAARRLADQLLAWDRTMAMESEDALAFHVFAHLVAAKTVRDDIALLYDIVMQVQAVYLLKLAALAHTDAFPDGDAVLQGGVEAILTEALVETAALLTERYPDSALGDVRRVDFWGAFGMGMDEGTSPSHGGESTVNVAASVFSDERGNINDQFVGSWIAIERTVTRFAADGTPEAWTNMPLGNVADPTSPHNGDLHEGWVEGEYRRLPFRRAEVEAASESRYTLSR